MESINKFLQTAAIIEEQIDRTIEKLDNFDENDLEILRRKRIEDYRRENLQKQMWLNNGHGKYEELPDERAFFNAVKTSHKVVCHFYLPSTERCKILHQHMQKIAPKYLETRFVCVNSEKFPFIVKNLNIRMIPTVAIIIESKTVDYIRGFNDLGDTDEFKTQTLEWRLAESGVIDYDGPSGLAGCGTNVAKFSKVSANTQRKMIRNGNNYGSDDE